MLGNFRALGSRFFLSANCIKTCIHITMDVMCCSHRVSGVRSAQTIDGTFLAYIYGPLLNNSSNLFNLHTTGPVSTKILTRTGTSSKVVRKVTSGQQFQILLQEPKSRGPCKTVGKKNDIPCGPCMTHHRSLLRGPYSTSRRGKDQRSQCLRANRGSKRNSQEY